MLYSFGNLLSLYEDSQLLVSININILSIFLSKYVQQFQPEFRSSSFFYSVSSFVQYSVQFFYYSYQRRLAFCAKNEKLKQLTKFFLRSSSRSKIISVQQEKNIKTHLELSITHTAYSTHSLILEHNILKKIYITKSSLKY